MINFSLFRGLTGHLQHRYADESGDLAVGCRHKGDSIPQLTEWTTSQPSRANNIMDEKLLCLGTGHHRTRLLADQSQVTYTILPVKTPNIWIVLGFDSRFRYRS
jgi:hypothetical protein